MFGSDWLFFAPVGRMKDGGKKTPIPIGSAFLRRGNSLTIRKWFFLFWTTLAIGTAAGMITGAVLKWTMDEFALLDPSLGVYEWLFLLFGVGTISVLSQMGFFAYLTVRYIALGFVRGKVLYWDILQVVFVVVTLFDLVYLRYVNFAEPGEPLAGYFVLPAFVLAVSVAVSYVKVKMTNRSAFVPTLFFMSTVTVLESVPALKLNDTGYTIVMIVPLLVCNAWQILMLHRILPSKND